MPSACEVVRVPIWRTAGSAAALPRYMTEGAAGCDLEAAIESSWLLAPLERCLVPTGLAIALPAGFEAQVRPRSGLAVREGITLVNSPGTIDSDYRGEIKVALINLSGEPRRIAPGDRIAQLVIARVARADWQLVAAVDGVATAGLRTERGDGGFGHTGVAAATGTGTEARTK